MDPLAVTFSMGHVITYGDFENQGNSGAIHGFLGVDASLGYRRLHATDIHGNALNLGNLSGVSRRGETTRSALNELLADFPNELIIIRTPED